MRHGINGLAGTLEIESEPQRRHCHLRQRARDPDRGRWMNHDTPVRVLIVDDHHPVGRDGLRGMFSGHPGFEVVGEVAVGAEAVARVAALRRMSSYGSAHARHRRRHRDRRAGPPRGSRRGLVIGPTLDRRRAPRATDGATR
jgi:hypothetical protein